MERSEPSLVPQWLKSSSSSHLQLASSLHSDNHSARLSRNKSSVSSDHDISRTSVSDKTTSAYFRQSSSSNTTNHPQSYGSFTKGRRVREWEKDINGYHDNKERHLEYADSLDNMLPSFDKDPLRRSQSLISGKWGDMWPRKVISDSNAAKKSNYNSGNALNIAGTIGDKSTFEDNFPSLAAEERQDGAEIGRVSSPGSNTAIQSFQGGTPVVTGGDGWTSALVEVPVNMGSSGTCVAAAQTVSASSASIVPTKTTALNMAETVAQAPTRARTPPRSQKLEELAIKQSRQLIPMTPSMPKTLVLSPSEKSKSKIGQNQYSSLSLNNSRGGAGRPDSLKTPNESKLQILKPSRELNGFSTTIKDTLSPTNGCKLVNSPISGSPSSTASAPFRSSSPSSSPTNVGRNPSSFRVTIEKRTMAQVQSRNDFFNLLKKKSSQNSPSAESDPGPAVSPSLSEKSDEVTAEDGSTSVTLHGGNVPPSSETSIAGLPTDTRSDMTHNGDAFGGSHQSSSKGEKHPTRHVFLGGEEEETAFLRSLGWDENAGEDEGLTEEEIHSFYEEYMKLRPSAKLSQGMQPKSPLSSVEGSTLDSNSEY